MMLNLYEYPAGETKPEQVHKALIPEIEINGN